MWLNHCFRKIGQSSITRKDTFWQCSMTLGSTCFRPVIVLTGSCGILPAILLCCCNLSSTYWQTHEDDFRGIGLGSSAKDHIFCHDKDSCQIAFPGIRIARNKRQLIRLILLNYDWSHPTRLKRMFCQSTFMRIEGLRN